MTKRPLWQLGAVELASAIAAREVRPSEAVAAAIERMETCNPGINAVTAPLKEEALAAALRADQIVDSGIALGPLHGVPITLKENIDQRGTANTNGLPALVNNVANDDSPVARHVREAGAIVIGRTNTPEFSYRWFTDNPLRGTTLNPWNADVTPGGSSGGAAAAVACGIGAIAHGNDLGGSLRYPAYACGVCTIKPGLGRVASFNPTASEERGPALQMMSVQGPIAREVKDLRLALEVMAREDVRDPWWVPAPLMGARAKSPIRVAVTYGPPGIDCHQTVRAAVDAAAGYLSDAGYAVEAVEPPDLAGLAERWRQLLGVETRELMMPAVEEMGSPLINELAHVFCEGGKDIDLHSYMKLSGDRTRLWRSWAVFHQTYPLVLAPVSQVPPFPQGSDRQGAQAYEELISHQSMLFVVNLLGAPAAAVPTGLIDDLPMGVQVIGARFREDLCLDAAQAIENRAGPLYPKLWARLA
jgi:amidase